MAVENCSDAAVFKVAKDFIHGLIPDQDKRFAPSVPDFATRCEYRDKTMESSIAMLQKMDPDKRDDTLALILQNSGKTDYDELTARLKVTGHLRISAGDDKEARDD